MPLGNPMIPHDPFLVSPQQLNRKYKSFSVYPRFLIVWAFSLMSKKLPQVFWDLHSGLPREGPGNNESTRRAFLMLEALQGNPRILDVGCGPGMQTIELARQIDALDNHQPLLDELERRAKDEGVRERINIVNGDMFALNYEDNSFDLVWCEGAIFIIGFEKGLREWRRLLTDNGYLGVSELSCARNAGRL
jgi:SAM-dependent methyltransferase